MINASHNLVAYVGDDLNIDCDIASLAQAADSTILLWYKNTKQLLYKPYSPPNTRVGWFKKNIFDKVHCRQIITLSIKNVTFDDSGNYSCAASISDFPKVVDSMLLTVTVPTKQPDYKSLILKTSIPVSVVIILLAILVVVGTYYYQHKRQMKLQKALEEYQKRPLPWKGKSTSFMCFHSHAFVCACLLQVIINMNFSLQ